MIKKLYLLIIINLFILLTSCKLVVENTTYTTITTNKDIHIIGFVIEEYNEQTKTVGEPHYFLSHHEIKLEESRFFNNSKIGTISNGTNRVNTIETDYMVDLDRPSISYTLAQIYVENGEIKKDLSTIGISNGISFSLALSSTLNNITSTHQVKFVDVDYLVEYKIIQFDQTNQKIREDLIQLTNQNHEFQLQKETEDFIISEKYQSYDKQIYVKKKIISVADLLAKYYQSHSEYVIALDQTGNRYTSSINFKVEGETN